MAAGHGLKSPGSVGIVDWVVFSFGRIFHVSFTVKCHAVFHETRDNRKITVTFPLNPRVLLNESAVGDFVTGYLVQLNG